MSNAELRRRAADLGVSVSYWDWRGQETTVSDDTLAAIVAALGDPAPGDVTLPTPPDGPPGKRPVRTPRAPVPGQRSWGFTVQLYSLRSRSSWGHGDLRDLTELAAWAARDLGAGFVLVNPLHAAEPLPPISPSPYLPMSRRWISPLYLRIEDIPEFQALNSPERQRLTALAAPLRAASGTAALIDRDAVWTAKRAALETLRAVPLPPARLASLDAFRVQHGRALDDWATWCAFAEVYGPDYRSWPARLRDPRSAETSVLRGALSARIEFHVWVQWLVAGQLATAQATARAAGMPIGIVGDLAVGAYPGGADAWAGQDVYVPGFSVGAPPDEFNQRGQDWTLPPWHPGRLAALDYRPLEDLISSTLGLPLVPPAGAVGRGPSGDGSPGGSSSGPLHGDGSAGGLHGDGSAGGLYSGGLRMDHVMGLSRLWWIPAGMPPSAGAYVRYDAEASLGALAAAAASAGAVAIGEDLGTVEPSLRDALPAHGVLGTSMLWFERGWAGEPLAPQWWRRDCLATVSTHDMPPAAAFLTGSQVSDRVALGLLTRSEAEERAEASKVVDEWLGALVREGLLPAGGRPDPDAFTAALYGYLAKTPAVLIGVSLAEAAGERRSQNMPGTTTEYPNWRLPLCGPDGDPVLLEDLPTSARVRAVARAAAGG
ncbi:MAG TPA: 4-alpha-glucanotransferase [Trebonia sp.]